MANYSYNKLKREFENLREYWMLTELPHFQALPNDNTSGADSKIYTRGKYNSVVSFFQMKKPLILFASE